MADCVKCEDWEERYQDQLAKVEYALKELEVIAKYGFTQKRLTDLVEVLRARGAPIVRS